MLSRDLKFRVIYFRSLLSSLALPVLSVLSSYGKKGKTLVSMIQCQATTVTQRTRFSQEERRSHVKIYLWSRQR